VSRSVAMAMVGRRRRSIAGMLSWTGSRSRREDEPGSEGSAEAAASSPYTLRQNSDWSLSLVAKTRGSRSTCDTGLCVVIHGRFTIWQRTTLPATSHNGKV
jgi:hypothetical protein